MYIAIDIGGTKTLVAAYSTDGKILRSQKQPTAKQVDQFMLDLPQLVTEVAADDSIDAIAVAAPALIDHETGIAKSFGNLEWTDVDIISKLKHDFTDKVYIDNDAKLGALGEANMGAGVGYETNLYVTLSTGIGTGITTNGKLVEALHDSEGGMMKFMHDGQLTRWEKFASGKAFFEEYGIYGSDDDNPEHWKKWAESVCIGMLDMISLIQPDVVVIGGSMGNHIDKYHGFLHDSIQKNRGPTVDMPVLVGAQDPDNAVINGCYVLCKQQLAQG